MLGLVRTASTTEKLKQPLSEKEALMQESLIERLKADGLPERLIEAVVDSGYFLKGWLSIGSAPHVSVSDPFYGNKAFSSSFEIDEFIAYLRGARPFEPAPPLRRERVRSAADIHEVLGAEPRARYLREGSLTFRGQPREYTVRRRIPNPRRGDNEGREISVMPGAYRQHGEFYSCAIKPKEQRSFELFAHAFEPEAVGDPNAAHFSYDLMRTEQHYATQTAGLDLAFDARSALFFATHQFQWNEQGKAFYRKIPRGEHLGVIYLFRFGSPSVLRTEFLIRDFDFFRTHRPERILRQVCALPLFGSYERNIALTEVDCIIELDADFEVQDELSPEYMFPDIEEDKFYCKLLQLKDSHPRILENVVEYRWARGVANRS